jgi:hypothetical protein
MPGRVPLAAAGSRRALGEIGNQQPAHAAQAAGKGQPAK